MITCNYRLEYYLDKDTKEYHIDLLHADSGALISHLYAPDKDALNRNLLTIKNIYNVIEEKYQGEL